LFTKENNLFHVQCPHKGLAQIEVPLQINPLVLPLGNALVIVVNHAIIVEEKRKKCKRRK
jgi:hypothetical protein